MDTVVHPEETPVGDPGDGSPGLSNTRINKPFSLASSGLEGKQGEYGIPAPPSRPRPVSLSARRALAVGAFGVRGSGLFTLPLLAAILRYCPAPIRSKPRNPTPSDGGWDAMRCRL